MGGRAGEEEKGPTLMSATIMLANGFSTTEGVGISAPCFAGVFVGAKKGCIVE